MWIDYFLLIFFSLIALFYIVLIKIKQQEEYPYQCVHQGEKFSLHWFNHAVFRIFRVAIWIYCLCRVITTQVDEWIPLISALCSDVMRSLGAVLMVTGFLIVVLSNMNMRSSWRSGIDNQSSINLVTNGLYGFSRNPAFLGVAIGQIGFFFAVPSVFSLICFLVGWVALAVQITLEERFLVKQFGDLYMQYKRNVPRII